jgi:T5SS/PEP-CTERM-associated repeat protein/autotransporter-associated beta strand protein
MKTNFFNLPLRFATALCLLLLAAAHPAFGAVTFTGDTSNLSTVIVGSTGQGSLTIDGGSSLSKAFSSYVGFLSGSLGNVTVSNGTWASSGELFMGYSGTGSLTISGGTVSNTNGFAGVNAGSTGTVNVSGGNWTNSGNLTIGSAGNGTLNLTGNGTVSVGSGLLSLAGSSGKTGTLNLGNGTAAGTLSAATITGGNGTAVVNINQSGSYTLGSNMTGRLSLNHIGTGTTTLTGNSTYAGNTTISAGTLLLAGGGSLGNGAVAVNGGQFTVNGAVGNGGVAVGNGATLAGNGTISGAVSIASGGTLAPGNSPGIINTGNLSLAAGSLLSAEITGSGTVAGTDYDQVNVTGTISLLGNLTLTLTSYTPADGQLIFLINNDLSDTITTGFANVNGGSLSNNTEFNLAGERWFISYEANYNGGTGSTFTGGNDVALYAVPEPGTWALLALTLTTAIVLRRRRAHS